MNVYQHVLPGMQAAAADMFSLLLRNQRNKMASKAEPAGERDTAPDPDASDADSDADAEGEQ
jgi:hypothetical protein